MTRLVATMPEALAQIGLQSPGNVLRHDQAGDDSSLRTIVPDERKPHPSHDIDEPFVNLDFDAVAIEAGHDLRFSEGRVVRASGHSRLHARKYRWGWAGWAAIAWPAALLIALVLFDLFAPVGRLSAHLQAVLN